MRLLPSAGALLALTNLSLQCTTDDDCNLNGVCSSSSGTCQCDPGWTASDCGALDVQPASRSNGYNRTAEGISSWGSKIVRDPQTSGLYHAFLAEFTHGCGLDYWSPYSRIVRAESRTGPLGPYQFVDQVVGHFAHNPTVVYSPADNNGEGEYLLYYIGCTEPVVAQPCTQTQFSCGPGNANNGESGISVQTSQDLLTWEFRGQVFPGLSNDSSWDADTTNPSPLETGVYPGSTAITVSNSTSTERKVAYRGCGVNCTLGELISVASAPDFEGPYTRLNGHEPIFSNAAEDPFLWRDKRGNFHLLVHSLEADGGFGSGPNVGRHAYARDFAGPWTFNTDTLAFSTVVEFDDGTTVDFFRRERPQLFFSDDGEMTPLVFTTGVQEVDSPMSYSLMVPVGLQAASS